MPTAIEIDIDPSRKVEVNIADVSHSPTVFAYRLWFKPPGQSDWQEFAKGDTRTPPPYHHARGGLPNNTKLLLKIALGSRKKADYHMVVTFLQEGVICANGILTEQGTTSGNGSAVIRREVALV